MPVRAASWTFEWQRSWSEIWDGSFENRWRRLLDAATWSHVYHRPELVRRWVETVGRACGAEPHFGMATSSSGAQLLLPWIIVPQDGRFIVRRTLESAGRDLFGYHTPLLAGAAPSEIDWSHFWSEARGSSGSTCDQALFRLIEPEFSAGLDLQRASEECPILSLARCTDLDAVLGRCSSSHRVDVKRQLRRARERGDVTLWCAGAAESAAALDSFRRELWPAYRAVWESRSATSTLISPAVEAFLELATSAGVQEGWTHYSVLRIGGTPVAWHLGLLDRGRLYYWVPTHDMSWGNYSPGKLLLAELAALGCRLGWREIHFLTGNHAYKSAWNPTARSMTAVAWTARTARGRLMAWYDARAHA
jgi:CelD/BcsL family acetyltransferase involved in cellulose biosynthesis